MNKRGLLLLKEIIQLLVAVIVIGLIIYAGVLLFRTYFGRQEELQAKGTLELLVSSLSKANQTGSKTDLLLYTPSGWWIVGFDSIHNQNEDFYKPNECWNLNCVCVCKKKCFCRTHQPNLPLMQKGKQALIKIEIKRVWFLNTGEVFDVTLEEPEEVAKLSEDEQASFKSGVKEIENSYGKIIKEEVQTHSEVLEFLSSDNFVKLIYAVIWHESRGKVDALSVCGAVGLMQLMPETAREQGLNVPLYEKICEGAACKDSYKGCGVAYECNSVQKEACNKAGDERFNPEKNLKAGISYLSNLLVKFKNLQLALAAYNTGEAKVREACKPLESIYSCPPDFAGRQYAAKVIAYYELS